MKAISKPILLKEVRDDGEHKKLLFNVLIKEDSLIIAAKARGKGEEWSPGTGTDDHH